MKSPGKTFDRYSKDLGTDELALGVFNLENGANKRRGFEDKKECKTTVRWRVAL